MTRTKLLLNPFIGPMKQPQPYRFKLATLEDAEAISQLILDNTDQVQANPYTAAQRQAWKAANTAEAIREQLQNRLVFCAWEGSTLLGIIGLKNQEVVGLYVHPAHLRKGIGQFLLVRLEAFAQTQGIEALSLFATPAGYPFYLRNGYQPIGEEDVIVRGVVFKETKMHKRLI